MEHLVLVLISASLIINLCKAQYSIPDVTLEAYSPKGFRAYIPDVPGIKFFSFNGKVNGIISNSEPGQIGGEARTPTNGVWEFSDPELRLVVGDKVSYWVFVQFDRLGYRKDGLNWEVKELTGKVECRDSVSVMSDGTKLCTGAIILEDNFNSNTIDSNIWTVEQYIPLYSEENYEFVSYQNIDDCRFIKESILYLKPIVVAQVQLRQDVDLRVGCTRAQTSSACFHTPRAAHLSPPVTSGKITSKKAFKYGKIEIRAKLPTGDWIYPQVELIPKNTNAPYTRLFIAYARGNERLTSNGDDIGGVLLFGGPVLKATEPARSTHLRSKRENSPFSSQFRIYSVIWSPDKIEVMVDNEIYGTIPTTSSEFSQLENNEFRVALGVGVGGGIDFPNGYKSGAFQKPWNNFDPKQIKYFTQAQSAWYGTWDADNVALQVDYIKVSAI